MTLPTPFETKRKKAPMGAYGRIQHLNVAEGMGLKDNLLQVTSMFRRFRSSRLVWWPEACSKRLAGMFGSVVSDRFAQSWRALAPSA
jgi:hypothetical protein